MIFVSQLLDFGELFLGVVVGWQVGQEHTRQLLLFCFRMSISRDPPSWYLLTGGVCSEPSRMPSDIL